MSLRPGHTYAGLAACLALLIGGVAWISHTTLGLDRAEAEAKAAASHEENVRLALWRMDSRVAPVVSAEMARPYFVYAPFHDPSRAYGAMIDGLGAPERLTPSPVLSDLPDEIELHFQIDGDGAWSSPQVPVGALRRRALDEVTAETLDAAEARLAAVRGRLDRRRLEAALERRGRLRELAEGEASDANELGDPVATKETKDKDAPIEAKAQAQAPTPTLVSQSRKSAEEWSTRARLVKAASSYNTLAQNPVLEKKKKGAPKRNQAVVDALDLPSAPVDEGPMQPVWIEEQLYLVRRVHVGGRTRLQAVWLDWPAIRDALTAEVRDLLPEARVEPDVGALDRAGRRLASLPVRLDPGPAPRPSRGTSATVLLVLGVAWAAVLLAAFAAVALVIGATALSERRAIFVSAVTHELRTPLTTFRMYTEMLADGMVSDEAKRARYLETLRREAARLGHLVENVLAYARIERGSDRTKRERFRLPDVVERFADRLRDRAAQADMAVELELGGDCPEVLADPGAVEQILFNLVDNACKYATAATDRRIHVEVGRDAGQVVLRVRDHGPGVDPTDARRMFSPFSKSAQRAAVSAPGVGLGLALSRRLARAMGGELEHEGRGPGASFALRLPIGAG